MLEITSYYISINGIITKHLLILARIGTIKKNFKNQLDMVMTNQSQHLGSFQEENKLVANMSYTARPFLPKNENNKQINK